MEIIEEKNYKIRTDKSNEMCLLLRNINNEEISIFLTNNYEYSSKEYELKCNLEEFQKNRFFKIFINIQEIMKELENKIEKSTFIEESNSIIIDIQIGLTIINDILLVIEEKEKNKDEKIEELEKYIKILEDKLNEKDNKLKLNEEKIDSQIKQINELKILLNNNEIKENENLKIENMNIFKTLNNNKGTIYCLKTLEDGRLAAGDEYSNLIIYNQETFNPDIIIQNNLGDLFNFTQLKNKNIACSFYNNFTLKIIKIKNNDYETIQTINYAHDDQINKILELKNGNLITFSHDFSFKIWKLNNNNEYEKINKIEDSNKLSDGIEIKDNKIILYTLNSNPQSLVFYDLNKNIKIKTLNNLNLSLSCSCKIIKIKDDEIAVAWNKKVYLIDINNYEILYEINSDYNNKCILKLSNNLFIIGDDKGTITQYKIENRRIIIISSKIRAHENRIWSMTLLKNMIISGGHYNEIKIWKLNI